MSTENQKVETVIAELEQKGYESLKKIVIPNKEDNKPDLEKLQTSLLSIITNGTNEFEEKTGRKMSYAEMRAAWG